MTHPRRNLLCPAVFLLLFLAARADVYVSPDGDDANPGTVAKPVRSLPRARDLVREQNREMTGDIVVHLAGGVYALSEPLVLDARDSGMNGHDVIYMAAPGQEPVISGGVRVVDWHLIDPSRNLWAARAPAGLDNTRQLYVDGVRALRARGRLPVALTMTATGYDADSPVMAGWRNPSDIEFVYTGGDTVWSERSEGLGPWTEPRCPVAEIHGTKIVMAEPCWDNSTRRVMYTGSQPHSSGRTANLVGPDSIGRSPAYVENAYELLGVPGQWYFDRRARMIYYVPRAGQQLLFADVEAPALESLIVGRGTPQAPVHNIIFNGLRFAYSTWLYPSSPGGFSDIQANYMITGDGGYATQGLGTLAPGGTLPYGNWTPAPGNLSFSYDHGIRFIRDVFAHLGAAGLRLGDGSQGDLVVGCVFTDISGNGLDLGGVDLPEAKGADATQDDRVLDNYFTDIAAEYHGGVAICVGYAARIQIEHNQIDRIPYAGISLGWGGWPDKVRLPGVANTSRNNLVAYNLIYDHMRLLADGGGIYTQGLTGPTLAAGERVVGNVVRDQFCSGHAIYTDNGSCNITVSGNVMFHTNFDNWGSRHGDYYGDNNGRVYDPLAIENNYWQQGDRDGSSRNVTESGNILIDSLDEVPDGVIYNAGLESDFTDLPKRRFGAAAAPAAPERVAVYAGDGFAYVAWSPPCFTGGSPVTSYRVLSSEGGGTTISAKDFMAAGYAKVSGLQDGKDYAFEVEAINDNGASPPSMPSDAVTPSASPIQAPSAPAYARAYVSDGRASVHFRAPENNGGSPVIAYVLTAEPGDHRVMVSGRAVIALDKRHTVFSTIGGLAGDGPFVVKVAAENAAGDGPAAVASQGSGEAR